MLKRIFYFPQPVLTHITTSDISQIVEDDVFNRHNYRPNDISDVNSLTIDPGGILDMNSVPFQFQSNGFIVDVKPEHILGANYYWMNTRTLDSKTDDGENLIKVYLGPYHIAVLREGLYQEVGCWLNSLTAEGYSARLDLADRLSECKNVFIATPKSRGDA